MSQLICLGLGYSAEHFVAAFGQKFDRIVGTMRSKERAAVLNAYDGGRLQALVFDGKSASPELQQAIVAADAALISVPQDADGDPVLRACGDAFAQARHLRSIVYLSTVGVYGDRGGDWVDEETPPSRNRRAAASGLRPSGLGRILARASGIAVAILRLAGIYGPGRNALLQIARGNARRIVKPGQIFNRIHVADIAQAIDAAFTRKPSGIFNVADDEPSPPGDPLVFRGAAFGRRAAAGNSLCRSRAVDVAAGAELLAGMPARA